MTDNLKPCPFCGSSVEIYEGIESAINQNGVLGISCGCGVEMESWYLLGDYEKPKPEDTKASARKKLIKQWNKRVKL